jgi:hypothetical protein
MPLSGSARNGGFRLRLESAYRLPCKAMADSTAFAKDVLERYGQPGTCDKCSPLTESEAKELEEQSNRDAEKFMARLRRHRPFFESIRTEHRRKGWAGLMVCPECGSDAMRVSVNKGNGHMMVSCPAEGCLRWIE